MPQVSAIVYSTDSSGNKVAKTISNVSASATATQIKTFAQSLNALSNNTYVETYRIERLNCDTEANNNG